LKQAMLIDNIRLTISPEANASHTAAEDRFIASVQELVNALVVTGINGNGDKINKIVNSVIRPGLETLINTQGGFHGFLQRLGLPCGPNTCPVPPSEASWPASLSSILACSVAAILALALACFGILEPAMLTAYCSRRSFAGRCLAMQGTTGLHWRLAVPLLVTVCTLLLVMSNTMDAAVMTVYLLSDGQAPMDVLSLKDFGIIASISDLWNANLRFLAMLIVIFSLFLPYAKLGLSLFIFWAPISTRRRNSIAALLDAVGKWSLLDAFVLSAMISLASFEVYFRGGLGVAIYIEPQWGLTAFLSATILCLIIGHVVLMLSHLAEEAESQAPNPKQLKLHLPKHLKLALCAFAGIFALNLVVICIGSAKRLCSLQVDGLLGWLLNYVRRMRPGTGAEGLEGVADKPGNVFEFSLISLGSQLSVMSSHTHPAQSLFLQFCYFFFTLGFGLLFLIQGIMLCIWLMTGSVSQLTPTRLKRLSQVGHVAFLGSALDVYAVGAIVTILEMGIGSFLQTSGSMRAWIGKTVRHVVDIPGASNEIATLIPTLRIGAFVILVGAILHFLTGFLFLRFLDELLRCGCDATAWRLFPGDEEASCWPVPDTGYSELLGSKGPGEKVHDGIFHAEVATDVSSMRDDG